MPGDNESVAYPVRFGPVGRRSDPGACLSRSNVPTRPEVTSIVRPTQNVYHPRMAENEKPLTNRKPTTWPGAIVAIALFVTVIILVQMILDYHW